MVLETSVVPKGSVVGTVGHYCVSDEDGGTRSLIVGR